MFLKMNYYNLIMIFIHFFKHFEIANHSNIMNILNGFKMFENKINKNYKKNTIET